MNNLSKEEMIDAIKEGVKEAILIMTESGDGYTGDIIREPFLNAIREGVQNAMWQLFTNATDAPCQDFFHHIKSGVKEGIESLDLDEKIEVRIN